MPEVWLFRSDRITIYQLQNDNYTVSDRSCYFPDLDILGLLAECFEVAENRNTSSAIRQLRQRLQES